MAIDWIAFDADDTLWHNEGYFRRARARFLELLGAYLPVEQVAAYLDRIEIENIRWYGYGTKSYGLSMIETALALSGETARSADLQAVIAIVKDMLTAPVEILPGVAETLARLAALRPLMLITKGDLLEQSGKLERSGLAHHFRRVEIISDKNPESYRALFEEHGMDPRRVLMIGNSLKSDVLPVIAIGGQAVHVPYETTWAHELAEPAEHERTYFEIEEIGQLVGLVEGLLL